LNNVCRSVIADLVVISQLLAFTIASHGGYNWPVQIVKALSQTAVRGTVQLRHPVVNPNIQVNEEVRESAHVQ